MPKNIVPYTSIAHSRERARERRQWLLSVLDENDGEPPRRTIVEEIPGITSSRERFSDLDNYPAELYGQVARLRWQLSSDSFLLLERVTDAVVQILISEVMTLFQSRVTIKLSRLRRTVLKRGLFPWCVTVHTYESTALARGLQDIADWIGIGVNVDEPSAIELLGRCQAGYDGKEGQVGGVLRLNNLYAVTCQHVISSQCNSLALTVPFGRPKNTFISAPDAVLLNMNTPCFEVSDLDAEVIEPAPAAWLEQCMIKRIPVVKAHRSFRNEGRGVVKALLSATSIGDRLYRFPQIEIISHLTSYLYGLLTLPFFNRRFSSPGDSGAWVCDAQHNMWLGMVVGGDDRGSTYAADASALLEYFELVARAGKFKFAATWPRNRWRKSWKK